MVIQLKAKINSWTLFVSFLIMTLIVLSISLVLANDYSLFSSQYVATTVSTATQHVETLVEIPNDNLFNTGFFILPLISLIPTLFFLAKHLYEKVSVQQDSDPIADAPL